MIVMAAPATVIMMYWLLEPPPTPTAIIIIIPGVAIVYGRFYVTAGDRERGDLFDRKSSIWFTCIYLDTCM